MYGASLFTNITPPSALGSALFEFYDLKTSEKPYRGVLRSTTKFVKFSTRLEGSET